MSVCNWHSDLRVLTSYIRAFQIDIISWFTSIFFVLPCVCNWHCSLNYEHLFYIYVTLELTPYPDLQILASYLRLFVINTISRFTNTCLGKAGELHPYSDLRPFVFNTIAWLRTVAWGERRVLHPYLDLQRFIGLLMFVCNWKPNLHIPYFLRTYICLELTTHLDLRSLASYLRSFGIDNILRFRYNTIPSHLRPFGINAIPRFALLFLV